MFLMNSCLFDNNYKNWTKTRYRMLSPNYLFYISIYMVLQTNMFSIDIKNQTVHTRFELELVKLNT